jgi:hypothetical protein
MNGKYTGTKFTLNRNVMSAELKINVVYTVGELVKKVY